MKIFQILLIALNFTLHGYVMAQSNPSPVEKAFNQSLSRMNAGQLYAKSDELTSNGDTERARVVLRALISRFPNHPLAVTAAKQMNGEGDSAGSNSAAERINKETAIKAAEAQAARDATAAQAAQAQAARDAAQAQADREAAQERANRLAAQEEAARAQAAKIAAEEAERQEQIAQAKRDKEIEELGKALGDLAATIRQNRQNKRK